jgi:hypothetical protein
MSDVEPRSACGVHAENGLHRGAVALSIAVAAVWYKRAGRPNMINSEQCAVGSILNRNS